MEKLYWAELRKAIAQRINADEKEVAQFMNALTPAIIKALREDRQVRISNFGTFKLQSIAPRKSVNVATGESFTLPGYDKLSFAPEASVKELIGNLNSSAEPSSKVNDEATPLKKLGEQATEIVGILNDLGQSPSTEEPSPNRDASETQAAETAIVETPVEEDKTEEPVVEETKPEEPVVEETKPEEPVAETKPEEPAPEPIVFTSPSKSKEKAPRKCRTWLVVSITILVFVALLAVAFLFVGQRFIEWVDKLHANNENTEIVAQPNTTEEETDITETPVEEVNTPTENTVPASTLPYPYEYKEFMAQEYLPRGSRLAWLARKYYNERDLWVFIYEANKDVVQHPSDIKIGTRIRIPKLPKELRDLSNPELRQLVDKLAEEYKKL